jgi:hypothetical protein
VTTGSVTSTARSSRCIAATSAAASPDDRAMIVGFSLGNQRGIILAADHPERVTGARRDLERVHRQIEALPERCREISGQDYSRDAQDEQDEPGSRQ